MAVRWSVRGGLEAELAPLLRDPEAEPAGPGARLIKHNNVRTVIALPLGGGRYFFKRYRARGALERLKQLVLGSKAEREWRMLQAFERAGLPTAEAIALGRDGRGLAQRRSYLVTREIDGVEPFIPFFQERARAGGKPELLARLAALSLRLHGAGILHRDLHGGNLLVRRRGADYELFVIDLHRASAGTRPGPGARLRNLAFFLHSLSKVTDAADRRFFLERYAEGGGGRVGPERAPAVEHAIGRLERRRIASRSRRCVLESSRFTVERSGELRGFRRRDLPRAELDEALARAEAALAPGRPGPDVLKRRKPGRRTELARVRAGGRALVVKRYAPRPLPLGPARGLGAWKAGNALLVRGVPAAEPLAFVTDRARVSWLVMVEEPGLRLDHALARGALEPRARAALGRGLAVLVGRLHREGVRHPDLKASNLLVEAAGGRVALKLLDYDRVRFGSGVVGLPDRAKNLAQLHASTPSVGARARLAFLARYRRELRDPVPARALIGEIGRAARGRKQAGDRPVE
jgi:tRNA A-37 threonylcarbamoyl transferase component Bud32